MNSPTVENYLKAIYHLSQDRSNETGANISTNALAAVMGTSAASVTDMIQRLSVKGLVYYEKYKGVRLHPDGEAVVIALIRRQRLWEVFLVDKLNMKWDQVSEIAEHLEHINSDLLIQKLDEFLGFPKVDPHGEVIPDRYGRIDDRPHVSLSTLTPGKEGVICAVTDDNSDFLKHIEQIGLELGKKVKVEQIFAYDQSMLLQIIGGTRQVISAKVSKQIYVVT